MATERKKRDVAGILHWLTPKQMAEEIVRLDAVLAGDRPNILMGRLPPAEPRFCGYTATGLRKVADGLDRGVVECIPGDCTNTQDELDRLGAARVLRALASSLGVAVDVKPCVTNPKATCQRPDLCASEGCAVRAAGVSASDHQTFPRHTP